MRSWNVQLPANVALTQPEFTPQDLTKQIKALKAEVKKVEQHASRHRAKARFLASMAADMSPSGPGQEVVQLQVACVPSFTAELATEADAATSFNSTTLSGTGRKALHSTASSSPATAKAADDAAPTHQGVTALPDSAVQGADLSQPVGQLPASQKDSKAYPAQVNEAFTRMTLGAEGLRENRRKQFAAVSIPCSPTWPLLPVLSPGVLCCGCVSGCPFKGASHEVAAQAPVVEAQLQHMACHILTCDSVDRAPCRACMRS